MRQSNIKIPFVFNLGLVLMCLMLVTFSMVGGLYARYSTTATGEATAQIAKFDVQVTGDTTKVDVDVAQVTEGVYTITITNNSDDSSRLTKFVNLSPSISLVMRGDINYISGQNYEKFSNQNFIRLLDGDNNFGIIGDVESIKFEWNNRRFI